MTNDSKPKTAIKRRKLQKQYKCPECNKKFTSKINKEKHLRIHVSNNANKHLCSQMNALINVKNAPKHSQRKAI